jgi:hypothetical protein
MDLGQTRRPALSCPRQVRLRSDGTLSAQSGNFPHGPIAGWTAARIDFSNAWGTHGRLRALSNDTGATARSVGAAPVAAYIKTMNEIINLRRVRKGKARVAAEAEAKANRAAHGRTKAERNLSKAQQEANARKLDGHKRDDN